MKLFIERVSNIFTFKSKYRGVLYFMYTPIEREFYLHCGEKKEKNIIRDFVGKYYI